MNKSLAQKLKDLFDQYDNVVEKEYEILETLEGELDNFHQWAVGKDHLKTYHVKNSNNDSEILKKVTQIFSENPESCNVSTDVGVLSSCNDNDLFELSGI